MCYVIYNAITFTLKLCNNENRVISLELCLIVFMCYGCDNQSNKTIYENVCDVALTVDLDLENDKVSFYDLFESVSIIQLETKEDILLHRIDKIVFHNDSIFIMDKSRGEYSCLIQKENI